MRTLLLLLVGAGSLLAQTPAYPSAVVTDKQLRTIANNLVTTLAAPMTTTDTTFSVTNSSRMAVNMLITVDSEIIAVCGVSGSVLQVGYSSCPNVDGRGFDNTTAAVHLQAAPVGVFVDAWHHNAVKAEVEAIESTLGPNLSNVPTAGTAVTSTYIWSQTPGGTLTSGILNTVTLTPCPKGVNATDTNHPVYISGGTGTAEAATIAGGTCVSGNASGTIIFTPTNNHSGAFTVATATHGIRECLISQGTGGACFVPSGINNIYGTLYDDALVDLYGTGINSIIQAQFDGDAIIIGPPTYTGTFTSVHDLFAQRNGGILDTSGAMWTFRNISNGNIHDLGSYLGYVGFKFYGVTQANWSNLWATGVSAAFLFTCPTGGSCPAGSNAGNFTNLWSDVQPGGDGIQIAPQVAGLNFTNLLVSAGANSIDIIPNAANGVIGELKITNASLDSATSAAITVQYASGTTENVGNTIEVSNSRLLTSGGAAFCVVCIEGTFGWKFTGNAFVAAGSGDVVTLGATHGNLFTGNQFIGSSSSTRDVVFQMAAGIVDSNITFTGNQMGFSDVTPTYAIASDGNAHTGIKFTGNTLNGGIGIVGSVNTFFDSSNTGLAIPAIASAAAFPMPYTPDFTVTGTTGWTSATNQVQGSHGTFYTTGAGFTITSGASIGSSCTVATGKLYLWQSDGTKLWINGSGC